MIVQFITRVVVFIVSLPIKILLAIRFSAIFTIAGFILGLLGGLIAGYFAFIYTEPSDYKVSAAASTATWQPQAVSAMCGSPFASYPESCLAVAS